MSVGGGGQAIRRGLLALAYFLAAAVTLGFLALPILAIFVHVPPGELIAQLSNPVVTDALVVSLKTTLIAQALVLVFGTPTAYLLASRRFPGRALAITLVELPLVLPPAVAGIGLLVAFGRVGLLGSTFEAAGITIPFTQTAVTLAVAFVASPLYIRQAIAAFDADASIGCMLITGSEKAFAAGADIKEMADKSAVDVFMGDFTGSWHAAANARKPVIAAVAGFALGGGCELAMQCDLIIAADTAKFGQPEIKLGIIPGIGGTQRLTHAVGKAKAMDLCLTGRRMHAEEAERAGLVSRVVPADVLQDEAMNIADKIANLSGHAVMMIKEAINRGFATTLAEGVRFERGQFYSLFATEDQKEGMAAFIEKRKPVFKNR